jgi:hypothetical protein
VITLGVQHTASDGTALVQRQFYTRRGRQVSVITTTTNAADAKTLQSTFESILQNLQPERK